MSFDSKNGYAPYGILEPVLTPEQMMADVKLLRAVSEGLLLALAYQAEGYFLDKMREALAATDRPEYREEG